MTRALIPLRAIYRRLEESGRPELPLLSVYRELGVIPREGREDNFNKASDDLTNYKVVRPGDLVLNKMKTWQGSLGVSSYEGIVSPAYFVGRKIADVDDRFMHHLLRSAPLIAEYGARSKGIRPSQWDLPWDEFASIKVRIPDISVQRAIADYLDAETTRIDALIEKKQRMLQLLDERFRVLVDDVAKTLPFECPIKRVGTVTYGLGQPPAPADAGVPIIRATNIDRGVISTADLVFANQDELPWDRCPPLRLGEILVVRSGALTGDSAMVTSDWIGAAPGYDLRVTPQSIVPAALAFQLLGTDYSRQIDLVRSRAAQPHLNADDLGNIVVRRGTQDEEEHASQVILRASSTRNRLSSLVQTQIGLLTEHRRGVITAAVTGELTIAGVAA